MLAPSNPVVLPNISLAWYRQGDFKQAAIVLENLQKTPSPTPQSLYLLAHCYLRLGRYADVVSLLDPIYESSPNDFAANLFLGSIEPSTMPLNPILLSLSDFAHLHPKRVSKALTILVFTGKLEEARREFEQLEGDCPDFLEVHVQLATLYSKLNLKPESQRERNIVLQLNEESRQTELRPGP